MVKKLLATANPNLIGDKLKIVGLAIFKRLT